jgi:hypothetical protein
LGTASAGDWPKDYIVKENSESPDGHYAVLVQSMGAATEQEDNESGANRFAKVKQEQIA